MRGYVADVLRVFQPASKGIVVHVRKLTPCFAALLPSFTFLAALAVTGALVAGGCGSGGSQKNPPLPDVVIRAVGAEDMRAKRITQWRETMVEGTPVVGRRRAPK